MRFMALTLCCLGLTVSCGNVGETDVQRRYMETVRRVGIVPVYPPRESLQVGDLLFVTFGYDPETMAVDPNDRFEVWIGDLTQVADAASRFMGSRIVFRSGASREDGKSDSGATGSDLYGSSLSRRSDLTVEDLPIAAFPTISADAGLTTGGAIASLLRTLGFGAGRRTYVRLQFEDVRTYWVEPLALNLDEYQKKVEELYFDISLGLSSAPVVQMKQEIFRGQAAGREPSSMRCATILLVTRIYLTRNIKYTYYNGQIIAAGIRRAEQGSQVTNIPSPPEINLTINTTADAGDPDILSGTGDAIASIQTELSKVGASGSEGSGLNFESWNALGLSFTQEYTRPVAIGYEGFSFPQDAPAAVILKGTDEERAEANMKGFAACPTL